MPLPALTRCAGAWEPAYDVAMRALRRKIPNFSLYGEQSDGATLSQSTHVEDIPSRSRKYLWQIDTHRHFELSQCVFVTAGPVAVTLEDSRLNLQGPAAILVPAGTVHSFRFCPATKGYVLTVSLPRLLSTIDAAHQASIAAMFETPVAVDFGFNPGLATRASELLDCLLREYRRPERLPDAVAAWLACSALSIIADGCRSREVARSSSTDLAQMQAFRSLVEIQYARHWPVSRYARILQQSETTLNRLCRRLTGRTAFHLIQLRLALEAKRRLIYSGASISGIARELGFQELAYFSRFFRRHSGTSPSRFRLANGGGKVPASGGIVQ